MVGELEGDLMDADRRKTLLYGQRRDELSAEPMEVLRGLLELRELLELQEQMLTASMLRELELDPRERKNPSHAWAQSHQRVTGPMKDQLLKYSESLLPRKDLQEE